MIILAASPTIDFSPLIPIINDLIQYVLAPVAGIAVTAASGFFVQFLLRHGALKNQQQAQIVSDRISGMADRLVTYNVEQLKEMVPSKLIVAVPNKTIETLANYAIAQAPDLLKKAGMNPTTKDGQDALVRLITARIDAPPSPSSTVEVKVDAAPIPSSGNI